MKQIAYKKELFDLIKDLTAITSQIIVEKDEDSIVIRRADSESTIAYQLKVPKEYFDFPAEQIAFYNYPEFYQYFKTFNEPELFVDENILLMKEYSSKSNYLLSNPESIQAGPKSINFQNPDFRINLSSEDLEELLKMISLINSKKAQLTGNDIDGITMKIFNNLHDNNFEKTFKVENLTKYEDSIDFVMFSDTFKNLPPRRNYIIEIKAEGFVKISLVDEIMKLDIYTGRVKG